MSDKDIHSQRRMAVARRWLTGVPYEVAFWRSYYANRKRRRQLMEWSQYDRECSLDDFDIAAFIASCPTEEPLLLDVGCAMSYAFGNIVGGRPRRVVYIDPLAPFYNRILHRYRIDRPEISFGMAEYLSATNAGIRADFIHIRNALDHCADPMEGILQALACLRVGGVLYLNHFDNEALREAYRGFHQYNITEEDGKLLIWDRKLRKTWVDDTVAPFASVRTTVTPAGRVVAVITKTAEVPLSVVDPAETARRLGLITIEIVDWHHSLPHAIRYQWLRLFCTAGHRIVRRLPFWMQRRLKWLFGRFM